MVKKTIGGSKNGGSREVATTKAPKYYPADDVPVAVKRDSAGVAKLRKSISPGSVLTLLAGRFRGKRVVCLKQLPSQPQPLFPLLQPLLQLELKSKISL